LKAKLLLGSSFPEEEFRQVARYTEIYRLSEMGEQELDSVLPSIDCLLVQLWPERLDRKRLAGMTRLSLVQSGLAGVNHIPFGHLSRKVVVCSNAGGYSDEVAEYAWGLLLSAGKRVVKLDRQMRKRGFRRASTAELGRDILVLKGKVLGILGYGGIGRAVARFGKTFGMDVVVLSRRPMEEPGVLSLQGRAGLETLLHGCDVLVLALPLTRFTRNMIGGTELSMMKRDAVLVNVARAEIVDEAAIYRHLVSNSGFVYATDVWWMKGDQESYSPSLPFLKLDNFIGTPHASGPSAVAGRGPLRKAVKNLLRFLRGEELLNVVDRGEYV
jgi:phosphoglycerate dehydrogenase-like enzyme